MEILRPIGSAIEIIRRNKERAALVAAAVGSIFAPVPASALEILRDYPQCGTPSNPNSGLTHWVTQFEEEGGRINYDVVQLGPLPNQCGNSGEVQEWRAIIETTDTAGDGYDYGQTFIPHKLIGAHGYMFETYGKEVGFSLERATDSYGPAGLRSRMKKTSPTGVHKGALRLAVTNRFGNRIEVRDIDITFFYGTKAQIDRLPKP